MHNLFWVAFWCALQLQAAPGDGQWDTQFRAAEYGMWLKVASAGSNVYLTGNFTRIGDVAANNIGRWDGTNWHPVGTGLLGTVTCLAATERYVYAAGGLSEGGISRWDGTKWTVLGQYMYPVVLAAQGEDVYAADAKSAGPFGPYIYKWTGTTWEALGGGLWGAFCIEVSKPINAIAINGKDVYVGGKFVGFGNLTNLAKWDGTNWSDVGGGVDLVDTTYGTCEVISSLVFQDGKLYVGGHFNRAGSLRTNVANVACWDGTNWTTFNGGLGREFESVQSVALINGTNLYAGGWFEVPGSPGFTNLARWDGAVWAPMGSGISSGWAEHAEVQSLAALDTDLFVTGVFGFAGGQSAGNFAIWHQDNTRPRLQTKRAGADLLLDWSSQYTGYRLQTATNIAGPWEMHTPAQAITGNSIMATNRITEPRQFYRLVGE